MRSSKRVHAQRLAQLGLSEENQYDFSIPVVIDGQQVDLVGHMELRGRQGREVEVTLDFPDEYSSAFSETLRSSQLYDKSPDHLVHIMLSAYPIHKLVYPKTDSFLHAFYSARQKEEYYQTVNEAESYALRGIATKTLCYTLSRLVGLGLLLPTSVMGVEASGTAPNRDKENLAGTIYVSLGFEKQKDLRHGDWYLHTTVENILQHCHARLQNM